MGGMCYMLARWLVKIVARNVYMHHQRQSQNATDKVRNGAKSQPMYLVMKYTLQATRYTVQTQKRTRKK